MYWSDVNKIHRMLESRSLTHPGFKESQISLFYSKLQILNIGCLDAAKLTILRDSASPWLYLLYITLYEHRVLKAWMKIYNMLHFPQVTLVFCRVQVFYLPHVHIQPPAVVKPFFSGKEKSPSSTVPQVIPPPHATKNIWTVSSYQCLNRMNTEQQPMDLWIYIMFYWGYPLVN